MNHHSSLPEGAGDDAYLSEFEMRRAFELLFYAYRDFTAEPDALLARFGFGRAHHRVIYFVKVNPEITVNRLLDILKITKQSLSRVLGQLVREGFIAQETDAGDRRRRMLTLTAKGEDLERQLTACQSIRVGRAYRAAGRDAVVGFKQVLLAMINDEDRERFALNP
ncbi:MarR family winged helix-turn-helix transcriptional regulator [Varunaivibrio sulfuroxidans]|uniref:DNA-binding MarR family transcriptional regulator n=1 Tax=Varunaivibrio sulfuroxidans TaxID=1773489 RepID=A0A4R3J4T9_9PROT|nr:MarR family winged helix-turn-helix transcriptional regulator [Varunaivibrio sulfuroxidans]TCS60889.1 DNA-binding MarR family transcriptional regulator [Varunaivibrio sulfuroxidans]WES31702.1 MarR family winged helix-turn-helix transcriptional regulator [Varunaivibrio sulfuroxidans]